MVCPAEIFNGPLRVGSKSSLVCGLQPITGKKWTNELVTRCKSLLFFPVVSTSVPREYRFHFQPPFRVNSPSLHLSVGTCIRYFLTAIVHFKCALLPNVTLCVVLLYFALDAKQVVWPNSPLVLI